MRRTLAVLALSVLVSTTAHASRSAEQPTATHAPAAKVLSDRARGARAAAIVRDSLKGWAHSDAKLVVRPAIVPFNGSAHNPITGLGPVEVFVTQQRQGRGLFGALLAKFNPYTKQKYLVHVGDDGKAQILERISLAPQRRLMTFLKQKLPLGAFVADFGNSGKLTESLVTAAGATGTLGVAPWLSGALYMRVGQLIYKGIESQRLARNAALGDTVAWAKETNKTSGAWPSFMETYRSYQSKLENRQPGARPVSLGEFATALSINQL